MAGLLAWDERLFSFFHSWAAHRGLATIFGALTNLGNGAFVLAAALGIWAWERLRRRPGRAGAAVFWTYLVSGLLAQILKHLVRRPRPWGPDPSSFPSGHTASAFALAEVLARRFPRAAWVFRFIAAAVGISRIVLGQHYPLDVLAGAALGILTTAGYFRSISRRRRDEGEVLTGRESQ